MFEIRPNARAQIFCFSHVQNNLLVIQKFVYARCLWQGIKLGLEGFGHIVRIIVLWYDCTMNLTKKQLKELEKCFKKEPLVKLAYLFGSQATGDTGPLSDYDFAVYADTKDKKESFYLKCHLSGCITGILHTDKVDVVMLDHSDSSVLKYNAIVDGILLYEQEPYKVQVEPRVMNEYFDYTQNMIRHQLTNLTI